MIFGDELETVRPSVSQWDYEIPDDDDDDDDDMSWTIDPYDDPVR